jgi:hypothetical protein
MMQKGVWLATAPDRHHQSIGNELGGHGAVHRPAYASGVGRSQAATAWC